MSLLLWLASALATPGSYTWQARVLDTLGAPVDGERDVVVALYAAEVGGTPVWTRSYVDTPVENGFVALELSGLHTDGVTDLGELLDNRDALYIEVDVETAADLPRQALRAVPFAARSRVTEGLQLVDTGVSGTCAQTGGMAWDTATSAVVSCVGSMWAPIQAAETCRGAEVLVDGSCVPCGHHAAYDLDPYHYWELDEAAGDTASGRRQDLETAGITRGVASPVVGSNGVDIPRNNAGGWLREVSSFDFPSADVSVSFWAASNEVSATPFSYANSASTNAFTLLRSATSDFLFNGATYTMNVDWSGGAYHHIVITREASTGLVRMYKDGVLGGTATAQPGVTLASGGAWFIGQEQDSVGGGLDGSQALGGPIDAFAMFDRELSASEVRRLYYGGICQAP